MIPFAPFSLLQLLLLLAPFLALALSAVLLLRGLHWWLRARKLATVHRPRLWTPTFTVLVVLALAGDVWALVLQQQLSKIRHTVELSTHYRQSREQFVLPEDFQYGELLIPRGSLINKYDAFDNGEPRRPLGLRGLRAVRFAHPVQVAGVWATAMEAYPAKLELARDQRIAPVFHFDPARGDWAPDPAHPFLDCKQGELAWFNVPLIPYDIQAEFNTPGPDGPAARFRPSQWAVTRCEAQASALEVLPAYTGPAPDGAQTPVWGPLPAQAGAH